MRHDERDLERRCVAEARRRGWVAWKNEGNGNKGIPDHSLMTPDGSAIFLIEFKRDDRQPLRPEQKLWAAKTPLFRLIFDFQQFTDFLADPDSIFFSEEEKKYRQNTEKI